VSIAVFDIDGVVADVRHRLHYLTSRPKDWDGFFDAAADDPLLPDGFTMVNKLAVEHDIVWLTGRPSWLRAVTRDWLIEHGLPGTELHMRSYGDYRSARLFKLGVLRQLAERDIAAFIDDDLEVIEATRSAGIASTFAEWLPRSATMREAQDRMGRS
jgi:phosphoglycolate phosphatase-like HAD superfamily hydrolase